MRKNVFLGSVFFVLTLFYHLRYDCLIFYTGIHFCLFLSQFEKIRDVRVYVVIAAYLFLEAGQVKWAHVPLYVLPPYAGERAYSPTAQR